MSEEKNKEVVKEEPKKLYQWFISFEVYFRQGFVKLDSNNDPVQSDEYAEQHALKNPKLIKRTFSTFIGTEYAYLTPYHVQVAMDRLQQNIESMNYKESNKEKYKKQFGDKKWNILEQQFRDATPLSISCVGYCSNEDFAIGMDSKKIPSFLDPSLSSK